MASAAPRGLKVPESCGFPGDTTILWRFHAGFRVPPRKRGGIPRVLRSPRPSQGDTREQSRADFGAGHAEQEVAERAAAFAVSRAVPLGGPLPLREGSASRRALGPAHGTDRR